MNYFERLIQRATAQPRQLIHPLVDPFAQEAPWELDPLPPSLALAPSERQQEGHPAAPFPLGSPESPAPAAGDSGEPPQHSPVVRSVPQPAAPTPLLGAPPQSLPLMATGQRPEEPQAPLAIADAFMRSLGVAQPTPIAQPSEPAPTGTLQPSQEPQAIRSPQNASSPEAPAASPPRALPRRPWSSAAPSPLSDPPLLRPLPAAVSPPPPAAPARPAATIPPPPEPAPGRPRASDPPRERIVQTTVVVSPRARRLDDLAHSSGVSRFGLGQS